MQTGTIALEGLEFFAYHGYYKEEQKTGNRYTVDLQVTSVIGDEVSDSNLGATIDYEKLYQMVAQAMQTKTKLLEDIAQRICHAVLANFERALEVEVSISKHNPPIGGVCARAKVTLKQSRTS
ncbi:dihydroneopterin aldolase [Cytophagales bacterium LB-30]|uniref:7,8-dihydroneopterin aldolase n=1 Tax=Shiella aurantiaca TaxID=3058365 RepID=A0ABT8F7Q9_9BACT|nr:dihydroneopterin aldolase [Shiella aurantiaca]MDN4166516.1 dihydroneopterin aldolase [Shiella aurantiaca]